METTENDIFIACNSSTELQRKSRLNKKHKKATRKNTSNKDFNNGAIGTFIPLNHFTNLSTEELNYSNTEKNDDHCMMIIPRTTRVLKRFLPGLKSYCEVSTDSFNKDNCNIKTFCGSISKRKRIKELSQYINNGSTQLCIILGTTSKQPLLYWKLILIMTHTMY